MAHLSQIVMLSLTVALCAGCTTLEEPETPPQPSYAVEPSAEGAFHELEKAFHERHRRTASGFLPVLRNEDALRWRLALIDSARVSLDFQYHVWFADTEVGGALLKERAIAAAERGVRVRVLVDDIKLDGLGPELASLDAQPNIEMRVFNPWEFREVGQIARSMEWLERKSRLNYRMHNKLLVADNQIAIIGGRNIGDHYFGFADDFAFHDLDVLGMGPVAREASAAFDHFWNSEWVVPGSAFGKPWSQARWREESAVNARALRNSPKMGRFEVSPQDWSGYLAALPERMQPGSARVVYDRLEDQGPDSEAYQALARLLAGAEIEILVANAYLIPDQDQIEGLRRTVDRGVRVRVITNSLGSNDVPVVNSAYRKSRRDLIEAGADLHELKHDATLLQLQSTPPSRPYFVTLHMKAFVVDRKRLYIGSLNLDPRSMTINTEKGVIIESPALAELVASAIERSMEPDNAWQVQLTEDDELLWVAGEERSGMQPAQNVLQLITDDVLSILPIPEEEL